MGASRVFGGTLSVLTLMLAPLSVPSAISAADRSTESRDASAIESGKGSFVFSGWQGPSLNIWTYSPPGIDQRNAPILFVLHGARRDPGRYRDEWAEVAERGGFIVIAPEFSRDDFPGSGRYNLGGAIDLRSGQWREEGLWSFSAIEPVFDNVVERLGSCRTRYSIYGHSAGSQFVHRFLFFKPDARVDRYLAANAGWYTFADQRIAFPFGLGNLPIDDAALRAALAKDVVILLGDRDTDPAGSSLNRSEGAMQQGAHRYARGQNFYAAARAIAQRNGWEFGWTLRIIEGVAHSNGGIARRAYDLVSSPDEQSLLQVQPQSDSSEPVNKACHERDSN